ncbi:hypothetical protein ANO14919_030560 [Xylariales sp. No.14919]|nr:hypothetical protein F5X98DRAFT_372467 [Xylaria grammica]GAW13667.1 hypothetical protein ANO14919_030560 [Xylariales sp. No.14919]
MDHGNNDQSRITRLPYELQLGIFCEMDDMKSVWSLALTYPQLNHVVNQNLEKITNAVFLNEACRIVKQLTGSHSLEVAKVGILLVCFTRSRDYCTLDPGASWLPGYLVSGKMPPTPGSTSELDLEQKLEHFKALIETCCEIENDVTIVYNHNMPSPSSSALRQILHTETPDYPREGCRVELDRDDLHFLLFTVFFFRKAYSCVSISGLMQLLMLAKFFAESMCYTSTSLA